MNEEKVEYKQITECRLSIGERWNKSFLVTYPVGVDYNGGFVEYTYTDGTTSNYYNSKKKVVSSKWYKGFRLAVSPKVPAGYKLKSIYCGLQMNCMPPLATDYLEPLDGMKKSRAVVKAALASV